MTHPLCLILAGKVLKFWVKFLKTTKNKQEFKKMKRLKD